MGRVFDVGLPTWIGEHFLNTGYPRPHSESPFYNQFLSQPSWMSYLISILLTIFDGKGNQKRNYRYGMDEERSL